MPWNLSSDERLAGFLNRILPSAGGSSSVEEMNESGSAQCGRGLPSRPNVARGPVFNTYGQD